MNRFKELFASMLKCILLLLQQTGSAISHVFFLKSWNINIKFPLILRISNYAYVWISLKHLFINKNKIKHYLFFQGLNPDQYVSVQQIRCYILDGVNRIKTAHWKNHPKKTTFLLILFRWRLKRMFDYAVDTWVVVTYGNQRFSGFIEDETVKILYFLPCKQEVLQKKLIKLPFLIAKWTSF